MLAPGSFVVMETNGSTAKKMMQTVEWDWSLLTGRQECSRLHRLSSLPLACPPSHRPLSVYYWAPLLHQMFHQGPSSPVCVPIACLWHQFCHLGVCSKSSCFLSQVLIYTSDWNE